MNGQPVGPSEGQPVGLLAYAAYVPVYRLGPDSGLRRPRVVASFDEDSTTMGVAAATRLGPVVPSQLLFATSSPTYLDKTNATAVHAALGLGADVFAADLTGTSRSTIAAIRGALAGGGLVVAADVRVGRPGSSDERAGGDGAAALLFGHGEPIAVFLAEASGTAEFLDRWRDPSKPVAEQWEERFGFERYAALVRETAGRALAAAGLAEADHVVITSPNTGVTKAPGTLAKGRLTTTGSPLGFSGAADLPLAVSAVLDTAGPGETILAISAADGCDVLLLRTTPALPAGRQAVPVAAQIAAGRTAPYPAYLTWRGLLEREPPRRPEPDRPAGPPSARSAEWKFAFTGSRCTRCGFVHLPPLRVCRNCAALDAMEPAPASRLTGTVATYTVDRLAYSPSPPVVDVVVDFDDGGRCTLEAADPDADAFDVGVRVGLTFRRMFTAAGVANYFWKARLLAPPGETEES
jgi:hydroxymethylglutaryl-CoA synthase